MKVGTLTFHKVNNFGAVLQAFALQKYIINLGYDSEIIDYTPIKQSNNQKKNIISKTRKYLTNPKRQLLARVTSEKFHLFRKENLFISKESYSGDHNIEITPPIYDYYMVGSDQVWNTDLSEKAKAFYLHFVKTGKKISYAASFGKEYFNDYEKDYIKRFLMSFEKISVREKHHADLLIDSFSLNVDVTLDPVFLLDVQEWNKITKQVKRLPNKYILVYVLEYSNELFECASKKAKDLNCEIIYISLIKEPISGRVLNGIGPSEFLYVFSNATYVCTNSFHGTAFSIIFNKNFSVVKHTTRNSRINNILEITGLKERYYDATNRIEINNIDYSLVKPRLKIAVENSRKFIQESLRIK